MGVILWVFFLGLARSLLLSLWKKVKGAAASSVRVKCLLIMISYYNNKNEEMVCRPKEVSCLEDSSRLIPKQSTNPRSIVILFK